ncbi:hypothetical protein O3597_07130 [Verrucosispora sp. WMMA2044]|uniref:Uncharacterized protein n=1 Tax=Verrucosispora sioxanthis TaxID=2499994 RepID=A0A6M1L7Q0_9ACTN|nr:MULTISPECIES: hypothetical protein [Micromonospora]NEE65155.1 hypothetical protein [Verrucosispora sioxanthis]NGM14265.1 hypothetical protein [Verrucosispora sioxanthis]WBB51934.1 hypothetical protein O3597_07130 [Verrucosispora sp. WMMA2044]
MGWPSTGGALTDQAEAGGALTGCPSADGPVTTDDQAGDALTGEGTPAAGSGGTGGSPARAASSSSSGPICWTRIVGRAHSGCPVEAAPLRADVDPSAAGQERSTPVCSSSSTR